MTEDDTQHPLPIDINDAAASALAVSDQHFSSALADAIALLTKAGASIDSETLLLIVLKNILADIAKESGEEMDLENLTKEQKKKLEAALERIAQEMQQAGLMDAEPGLQKLIRILVKSNTKTVDPAEEEKENGQEDEFESLSPKEKKRLKDLFRLFAVYEAYKISNPNQLAGETKQDNFINNLHMHGKSFAVHKAGSDMGLDEKHIKEMEKNSKSFVEGLTKFNAGKDTGWSR